MSTRLFIRNDDVWTLDRKFRFFFDLAVERSIPVVYAVIPGKMECRLVRFLCRAKEKTPQLLDIVQHGWIHANHSIDASSKYEFGKSRSLQFQRKDIYQGLQKMRLAFGEHFTPAFVPPYHGYDERTIKLIEELGFEIFSGGTRRPGSKKRFIEVPVQVSFTSYDQGQKSIRKAQEVIRDLAKSINRRPLTGVLMHHEDFSNVSSRRELTRFFDCIAALGPKEGWRALLFSDIVK